MRRLNVPPLEYLVQQVGAFGTSALVIAAVLVFIALVAFVIFRRKKKPAATPTPEPEKAREDLTPTPVQTSPAEVLTLRIALRGTQESLWGRVRSLLQTESPSIDELEEVLYTSDLGPQTVERLMEQIRPHSRDGIDHVRGLLRQEFHRIFDEAHVNEPVEGDPLAHLQVSSRPSVWMIVGVNGAGKTTTIGKISALLAQKGKKVLVAAGDTFRAAAQSQLKVWTERAQVEIFDPLGISDPSAVAYDAVAKAKAKDYDVVLIDTAGRLHTQSHLMDELKKVKRVLAKVIPESPHEVLIVLDANSGQNALHQAREFDQALGLTGLILTKMDGTAKGGVAIGISQELKRPIRLVGVGEKIVDLRAFSSRDFIDSILDLSSP
ncbi:MAG: signal recognition particle-docking protein FtsY [Bdellovibrio sp.]|nr:MAG: signal recognition particle-docking protein FtsY [Bdellovibrio sp.]